MIKLIFLLTGVICMGACTSTRGDTGETEITKWQYGKRGAVSITYDDGTINQFRVALPIMNDLDLPATFFINTGSIRGSQYMGRFIGRPVEEIIEESATEPANKDNFFERASAARYSGYRGTGEYHTRAGARIDADDPEGAWEVIDELYEKIRRGEFEPSGEPVSGPNVTGRVSWDDIRTYAEQGHEFASHMVTHPRMAALDEANMLYELEKSRKDILNQLGPRHTFSTELPFGTENERAMEYMYRYYPASRNRLPEPYLEELNRWNRADPGIPDKEYVQWQRGAYTSTPMQLMKSWVDTTAANDNVWLVLVFHGVDGIGWEALPGDMLKEYFEYIAANDDIWVATFGDAVRYMRQRMSSTVTVSQRFRRIYVTLECSLDPELYDIPLTLRTYVPDDWDEVKVKQENSTVKVTSRSGSEGSYVQYQAYPNAGTIEISKP